MSAKKVVNPFYIALVVIGALFGITALAYASVSGIAQRFPDMALESLESGHGLIAFMDRYGFNLMMIELGALAVLTVLAIGTDGYWERRAESQDVRATIPMVAVNDASAKSDSSTEEGVQA